MPRSERQKFALMGVFALGGLYVFTPTMIYCTVLTEVSSVLITSILRLKSLAVISNSTDPTCEYFTH